jgi:hypothetical protein
MLYSVMPTLLCGFMTVFLGSWIVCITGIPGGKPGFPQPRSGTVSCTPRAPRASPVFPAKGERDRAMPRPFLHDIVSPSPRANPLEPKPTSATRASSTNRARALKPARSWLQHSTTDPANHTPARSSQRRPESTAQLPNPWRSKPRAPSPPPRYKTLWIG